MSYFCFWLLSFSAFPLSLSLYPHSLLPLLQHITIFLSAVSPPLSFFTSLSLPILRLFLSLPVPHPLSAYLSLSAPLLPLLPLVHFFFTRLSPYPAGNNALHLRPVPSFLHHHISFFLYLHLSSSPAGPLLSQHITKGCSSLQQIQDLMVQILVHLKKKQLFNVLYHSGGIFQRSSNFLTEKPASKTGDAEFTREGLLKAAAKLHYGRCRTLCWCLTHTRG